MEKKWTILIYANGNNEFEPEMHQLLLDCQKVDANGKANIIIQIGREKRELARILRPQLPLKDDNLDWTGVRRYILEADENNGSSKLSLEKNLGNINLADPKVLYDFLAWAMVTYPAKKYLLLIGGHSFQYLGIMTDYSQNMPYILGVPEMAKALNLVQKNLGKYIEILVLDTCYMNMVEILYELAKAKKPTVKNILTYIEYGPFSGLPIDELLKLHLANLDMENSKQLLTRIIDGLDFDLVAFSLNKRNLESIKNLTHSLATDIVLNQKRKHCNLAEIWDSTDIQGPFFQEIITLKKHLLELVVYAKRVKNEQSNLIDLAHQESTNNLAAYYNRLSFSINNNWTKLLRVDLLQERITLPGDIQLKPLVLPLQALLSLIAVMNPKADENELEVILNNLLAFRKWDQFSNFNLK